MTYIKVQLKLLGNKSHTQTEYGHDYNTLTQYIPQRDINSHELASHCPLGLNFTEDTALV